MCDIYIYMYTQKWQDVVLSVVYHAFFSSSIKTSSIESHKILPHCFPVAKHSFYFMDLPRFI